MYKHLAQQKVQEGVHNDFVALFIKLFMFNKVRNSQVTNRVTQSDVIFVLLTQKFVRKFFFRWVNFFFITFELLTRGWKIKRFTSSY